MGIWRRTDVVRIVLLPLRKHSPLSLTPSPSPSHFIFSLHDTRERERKEREEKKRKKKRKKAQLFIEEKKKEFHSLCERSSLLSDYDLQQAKDWKSRMKVRSGLLLKRLMEVITPEEVFFQSIPLRTDPKYIHIIFPSPLPQSEIKDHLIQLAKEGITKHKKKLMGGTCLLPLSAAASLLPGPNFFFLWNIFRCYSHWRALAGSKTLLSWLSDSSSSSSSSSTKDSEDLRVNEPLLDPDRRTFQFEPSSSHESLDFTEDQKNKHSHSHSHPHSQTHTKDKTNTNKHKHKNSEKYSKKHSDNEHHQHHHHQDKTHKDKHEQKSVQIIWDQHKRMGQILNNHFHEEEILCSDGVRSIESLFPDFSFQTLSEKKKSHWNRSAF